MTIAPKLTTAKFDLTVSPDDVDVKLHGGEGEEFEEALISLIKHKVIPGVADAIKSGAKKLIDTTIDNDLKRYGT